MRGARCPLGVPFLAVGSAVVGGDIRTAIVARMGLNAQATRDING